MIRKCRGHRPIRVVRSHQFRVEHKHPAEFSRSAFESLLQLNSSREPLRAVFLLLGAGIGGRRGRRTPTRVRRFGEVLAWLFRSSFESGGGRFDLPGSRVKHSGHFVDQAFDTAHDGAGEIPERSLPSLFRFVPR